MLILALPAFAATLEVEASGAYPDLATAWAAAADGDTVLLGPGDWVAHDLDRAHGRLVLAPRDGAGTATVVAEGVGFTLLGTAQLVVRDLVVDGGAQAQLFDVREQGRLEVVDSTLRGGSAALHGGAIQVDDVGIATLLRARLESCYADVGGAVWIGDQATLRSAATTWADNRAGVGGALRCSAGTCVLTGDAFVDNQALFGGALSSQAGHPELVATRFEHNGVLGLLPTVDGGAVHAIGDLTVRGGRFCGNAAQEGGALQVSGALTVQHTGFVGNEADRHAAIALGTTPSVADHLLVLGNVSDDAAVEGAGVLELAWSLFHDNPGGHVLEPVLGDGVLVDVDPGIPATCDTLAQPLPPGSPAVDAGDPTLTDPDGSPADLGPSGGPWGPGATDADADGFSTATDCDDGDPTVHPAAPEVPADGIDQDCDGVDTCFRDVDLDGAAGHGIVDALTIDCTGLGEGPAPTDCDDDDPTAFPGAWPRYDDADGDGVGGALLEEACLPHDGPGVGGDCDDDDPATYPGAAESCDTPDLDRDCDGLVAADDPDTNGDCTEPGATADTGTAPVDTGTPVPPTPTTPPSTSSPTTSAPDDAPDEAKGCGCHSAPGPLPGLLGFGLLLPWARRR